MTDYNAPKPPRPKTRNVARGELFFVSSGEYSDYQVNGIFKCLKEFNPDEFACPATKRIYSEVNKTWYASFEEEAYLSLLTIGGFIEQVPAFEFHLSDYGDYEPSISEFKK